ncbi:UDP-4-amino-4,6-dideoxy-N-acetyl-beta-L-altrosamine N-acetyltransferase [Marinobacter sp.]|uniref:UDP-4-amino-4, 6-dideoxy-N-acetyl-beta-L-altrosamine N-acetyltransferase n=1 Tax=Marinobacter sp. TaxID=50741 RepID=UPI003A91FAA5
MSLRDIQEEDLELMLSWRNHPSVRSSMFSQSTIELQQHQAWFSREAKKDDSAWLFFVDENDIPAGVVYFTDMDRTANHAFWGFYAAPDAPPGTGTKMGVEALDYFFQALGFHKLNAEVLERNQRSQRFHQKLGFQTEGVFRDHYMGGSGYESVTRFGLLNGEWSAHRHKLLLG